MRDDPGAPAPRIVMQSSASHHCSSSARSASRGEARGPVCEVSFDTASERASVSDIVWKIMLTRRPRHATAISSASITRFALASPRTPVATICRSRTLTPAAWGAPAVASMMMPRRIGRSRRACARAGAVVRGNSPSSAIAMRRRVVVLWICPDIRPGCRAKGSHRAGSA